MTSCDTETCELCQGVTVLGLDALGRCEVCSGDTSLEHLLRLSAVGLTRDRSSGRFRSIKEK